MFSCKVEWQKKLRKNWGNPEATIDCFEHKVLQNWVQIKLKELQYYILY